MKQVAKQPNSGKENSSYNTYNNFLPIIVALIAVAGIGYFFLSSSLGPKAPVVVLPQQETGSVSEAPVAAEEFDEESYPVVTVDPTKFAVRQRYFEEAFRPKRQNYYLFRKAATHLGIPIEDAPKFFSLNNEAEVFEELPKVPEDFSEVAYLLANGRFFAIGQLSEEYFLQPEFYPNFKATGLKYWTKPDAKYWTTNGYGTYPSEQFDILSKSGRGEFTGVIFFTTGYGVQTYQGTTIIPSSESLQYFDIEVTPDTFLLTPTFPKFAKGWARQIIIKGKLKPGTPQGDYNLRFLVVFPPSEKDEEWGFKYRNLYTHAASSIAASGAPFTFHVKVTE